MSSSEDYLKALQDIECSHGIMKLRTLLLEFNSTLERVPSLKKELDKMLFPLDGVNYDELSEKIEKQLEQAANLVAWVDMLSSEVREDTNIVELFKRLQSELTLRTIDIWRNELETKCDEAIKRIARSKLEANEQERKKQLEVEENTRIEKAREQARLEKKAKMESGSIKLRSLLLKFEMTLSHLPNLKFELEKMLAPQDDINYDDLILRIEPQLERASSLFISIDELPEDFHDSQVLVEVLQRLKNTQSLDVFDDNCSNAIKLLEQMKHDYLIELNNWVAEECEKLEAERRDLEWTFNQIFYVDSQTGLQWPRNANIAYDIMGCAEGSIMKKMFNTDDLMSWYDAVRWVETLDICGYQDWRLPTKEELSGLLMRTLKWLEDNGFYNFPTTSYWTSSSSATSGFFSTDGVWTVSKDGNMHKNNYKNGRNHVWPVRDVD